MVNEIRTNMTTENTIKKREKSLLASAAEKGKAFPVRSITLEEKQF